MDDSNNSRYYIVLGRNILTVLLLNLKFSEHVIKSDYVPFFFKSTAPKVDFGPYQFKYLNTGENTPEEYFLNAYVDEVYELKHVLTSTKILRTIVYAKYEKVDLNKVMKNQCQHLIETQCNELLKLLQ